jgi:tRNA(Arg) A34 adenosine deaminase TadA
VLSSEFVEQIAYDLTRENSQPVAFLADAQAILFSRGPRPILSLIQAVYDHRPDMARRILRARIFSTAAPTEACRGMIKVAAKRATAPVEPRDQHLSLDFKFREISPLPPPPLVLWDGLSENSKALLERKQPMAAAFQIATEIPRQENLYQSDRKVAAVLLSIDGDFIAASKNANAVNRTRHAELNLVQGLAAAGKVLPRGARLYVTLKCCKMCAAAIWCGAEDIQSVRVIYGEDDPGPNARDSILLRNGLLISDDSAQDLK